MLRQDTNPQEVYQTYLTILRELEKSIYYAETKEEKLKLATKSLSRSVFRLMPIGAVKLEAAVRQQPIDENDMTNALALAICLGLPDSVANILALFDKDSINDKNYFVWGYRQPYSFVHLAAHPQVHMNFADAFPSEESYVDAQIQIIKLLKNGGADPSLVVQVGQIYTNPPLAAGEPMGHTCFSPKMLCRIRAALLLVGADPNYVGSSYRLYSLGVNPAMQEATNQYLAMSQDERNHVAKMMHKEVAGNIADYIRKAFLEPLKVHEAEPDNQRSYTAKMF